jgi:MFS family permease
LQAKKPAPAGKFDAFGHVRYARAMYAERPALWTKGFILIMGGHVCVTVGFYATMPVYSLFLADRFALSGLVLGAAVACYTASAILTRPPTGFCLDKFGRRGIYLYSYLLFALTYLLYPVTGGPAGASLVRILHGALWGTVMGAAMTVAVDLLPPSRRGEGIGYYGLAMILGMSLGPGIGVQIVNLYGYDAMFRGAALLALAGWLLVRRIPFPVIAPASRPFSLSGMVERTSLPVCLSVAIFCIPYGVVMNYTGLYARTLPEVSAGLFFLVMALGTAATRLFSGRIFDRSGPGMLMAGGYGCMVLGYVLMACARGPLSFTLAGLCTGLGYGIATPITQGMVNALVPAQRRGAANATHMTAFDVGICIGLVLIAPVRDMFGWFSVYCLLGACVCLSACAFRCLALPAYRGAVKQ